MWNESFFQETILEIPNTRFFFTWNEIKSSRQIDFNDVFQMNFGFKCWQKFRESNVFTRDGFSFLLLPQSQFLQIWFKVKFLTRFFSKIPWNQLFPFTKLCIEFVCVESTNLFACNFTAAIYLHFEFDFTSFGKNPLYNRITNLTKIEILNYNCGINVHIATNCIHSSTNCGINVLNRRQFVLYNRMKSTRTICCQDEL